MMVSNDIVSASYNNIDNIIIKLGLSPLISTAKQCKL